MFSIHTIKVPMVALTPPPDQAEANWLLRGFTSSSLSHWSPCRQFHGHETLTQHEANVQLQDAAYRAGLQSGAPLVESRRLSHPVPSVSGTVAAGMFAGQLGDGPTSWHSEQQLPPCMSGLRCEHMTGICGLCRRSSKGEVIIGAWQMTADARGAE